MSLAKQKKQELAKLTNDAKTLYAEMESSKDKQTTENREKFNNYIETGKSLRAEIEQLESLDEFNTYTNEPAGDEGKSGQNPAGDDANLEHRRFRKSVGDIVIGSNEFKTADRESGKMRAVPAKGLISALSQRKGLFNTTDAQGGHLVRADREAEMLHIARQRPFTIMDLINVGQTSVDAVEYVLMTTRTSNAAVVPEIDASRTHVSTGGADAIAIDNGNYGENFAMKPKGDLAFDLKTALVKTIAEWIPASRQILSDAPNLRSMVDNELIYQVEFALENQIVTGNGSGNNFTGILNTANIQSRVHKTSGRDFTANDSVADTLRRAITDIALEFYEADGILMNPIQTEEMELEKGSDGHYVMVYDPVLQRVWRKPIRETQAVPDGTAVVGAFKVGAKLWDREQSNIRVGEPGNFFLQNAVAILAELRAAFAVTRPRAIEKVTGL